MMRVRINARPMPGLELLYLRHLDESQIGVRYPRGDSFHCFLQPAKIVHVFKPHRKYLIGAGRGRAVRSKLEPASSKKQETV